MTDVKVDGTILWIAPFYNRSGFGVGARTAVIEMIKRGINIKIIPVDGEEQGLNDVDMELIRTLENTTVVPPITLIVSHVINEVWTHLDLPEPSLKIISTAYDSNNKTDSHSKEVLSVLKKMDQIWFNTYKEMDGFVEAGIDAEKIKVIHFPHPWLENKTIPLVNEEEFSPDKPYRFLSIAIFQPRRRWDTLIEGYLTEFKNNENVELYLKVSYPVWHPIPGKPKEELHNLIKNLRIKTNSEAKIIVDEELGTRLDLIKLIDSCNTYVSADTTPTAPVSEARARNRLVIVPHGINYVENDLIQLEIRVDPNVKMALTDDMLLYGHQQKGDLLPVLFVEEVRKTLRDAYELPKDQREKICSASIKHLPTPGKTIPQIIEAINEGWKYKKRNYPELFKKENTSTNEQFGFSSKKATGKLPEVLPSPLKLNLGCGRDILEGFLNLDLYADTPEVIAMDIRKLDFDDNTVDQILARDVLEHFSFREINRVLKEWARVLKPGGEIIIRSPSLELQAKAYLDGKWNADVASYMIFGGQTSPGDFHHIAFDQESITRHLKNVNLEIVDYLKEDVSQENGYCNLNFTAKAIKKERKTKIIWEGSQFVYHSLALINREQCLRLMKSDYELSIKPYEKEQFVPDTDDEFFGLTKLFNKDIGYADIHVRHHWPPNLTPPDNGKWIIIQPWEFGYLPKDWANVFSNEVDEMWVPSTYVKNVYIKSGIPAERVVVVPNGINSTQFNPDVEQYKLKSNKNFKFLFVGGTIFRKGIDILLEVYINTFSSQDDVCLVIKDFGGDSFYQGKNVKEIIAELKQNPKHPEIEYIDSILSEKELAGLYKASDVLVHPYRGEGFGIPIIEAMACGTPAVVTNGGACLDFCNSENSFLVDAELIRYDRKDVDGMELTDNLSMHEVSKQDLQKKMLYVAGNQNEIEEKGKIASEFVRTKFTWDESSKTLKKRITELLKKETLRFKSSGSTTSINKEIHYEKKQQYSLSELYKKIQEAIETQNFKEATTLLEIIFADKNYSNVFPEDVKTKLNVVYEKIKELNKT